MVIINIIIIISMNYFTVNVLVQLFTFFAASSLQWVSLSNQSKEMIDLIIVVTTVMMMIENEQRLTLVVADGDDDDKHHSDDDDENKQRVALVLASEDFHCAPICHFLGVKIQHE